MTCLHTISRSPSHGLLEQCLALARPGDGIFFIEDGVYHCLDTRVSLRISGRILLFCLKEDMEARGIKHLDKAEMEIAGYSRFVELCCKFDKIVNWF